MDEKEEYKREICELIMKCDDLHWLKVIHTYIKKLLG